MAEDDEATVCPFCGEPISETDVECPACKQSLAGA
jgi:rubrerythrin